MPTLAEALEQNKQKQLVRGPEGDLTEQTPQSVQTLATQAGLQAPPTTPLGQATIGANPHQQKMAGTPAQVTAANALSMAPAQQNNLQATQRTQQVRSQANTQEQAAQQKSTDMQNLGALGDRVTDFIQKQRENLQTQATAAQGQNQGVAVAATDQFNGKDISGIKPLLAQLRANPSDMNLQLQVNQALGYNTATQLSPDQINSLYQSATDAIATGGAGIVDNDLSVDDLIGMGNFNYSKQELSHLLNIPEEQVGSMSVADIRNAVQKTQDQEFSKSKTLDQQAESNNLGQAERGLAQQAGQEASKVGTRSSEADVSKLEQQITNADQVQFGGQSYAVEDLLKDNTISGIISNYLNSAPGSDARNQLDKTEPQLSAFIKNNEAVLDDAAKQLSTGAQGFSDIQTANTSLQNFGGIQLDADLAKQVIPGFGTLQANKIDPSQVPLLNYVQQQATSNPNAAMQTANELNARKQADPEITNQLSGLNQDDWNHLDIANNGPNWQKYKAARDAELQIKNAPTWNADDFVKNVTTDGATYGQLQDRLDQSRVLDVLEGKGAGGIQVPEYLDADHDGKLDSPDQIKQSVLAGMGNVDLKQAASGNVPSPFKAATVGTPNQPETDLDNSLVSKLSKYALDGNVSGDDLKNANLSDDELFELHNISKKSDSSMFDGDSLEQMITKSQQDKAAPYLSSANHEISDAGSILDKLNSIATAPSGAGSTVNGAGLNQALSRRDKEVTSLQNQIDSVKSALALGNRVDSTSLKSILDNLTSTQKQLKNWNPKAKATDVAANSSKNSRYGENSSNGVND